MKKFKLKDEFETVLNSKYVVMFQKIYKNGKYGIYVYYNNSQADFMYDSQTIRDDVYNDMIVNS